MPSSPDITQYCNVMEEVKKRMGVVDFFGSGAAHALYGATTVETIYLQFRKILELVAIASLVANKKAYAAAHRKFAKHWNAKRILKRMARINADFYPRPIIEEASNEPGVTAEWLDRTDDFLTRGEFVELYGKCNALMHARNPYGSPVDYTAYERAIPRWRTRIINLLSCHWFRPVGDPNSYVFHMMQAQDGKVHAWTFGPTDAPQGSV